MLCERHNKMLYSSKNTARGSLTGQLKSKRVRVYPCDEHKGHYHLTKEKATKLDHRHRHT